MFYEYCVSLDNGGIAYGYKDGSFRPDLPISRAQLAVILARYDRSN